MVMLSGDVLEGTAKVTSHVGVQLVIVNMTKKRTR